MEKVMKMALTSFVFGMLGGKIYSYMKNRNIVSTIDECVRQGVSVDDVMSVGYVFTNNNQHFSTRLGNSDEFMKGFTGARFTMVGNDQFVRSFSSEEDKSRIYCDKETKSLYVNILAYKEQAAATQGSTYWFYDYANVLTDNMPTTSIDYDEENTVLEAKYMANKEVKSWTNFV